MEYTNFRKINLPEKEHSKEIIIFYFSWDNSLKRKKKMFLQRKVSLEIRIFNVPYFQGIRNIIQKFSLRPELNKFP